MPSRWSLLVLFLLIAGLPVAAFAREPLLVIIDLEQHCVYVPVGSVIPAGIAIRAEPLQDPFSRGVGLRRQSRLMESRIRKLSVPPLAIRYAPVERFAQLRQRYEAQQKAAERRNPRRLIAVDTDHDCFPFYASDSQTGVYGTYYNDFTSTFCQPTGTITSGNSYLWEFTASGAYTEDDEWVYPYAAVYDENNNFNCVYDAYGYTSPVECTASATTQLLQVGCLNTVTTMAQLYTIEYLQNYEPYYLGYVFSIEYCTYFY